MNCISVTHTELSTYDELFFKRDFMTKYNTLQNSSIQIQFNNTKWVKGLSHKFYKLRLSAYTEYSTT